MLSPNCLCKKKSYRSIKKYAEKKNKAENNDAKNFKSKKSTEKKPCKKLSPTKAQ